MNLAGADGILNTGDNGETLESDNLERFTREIRITDFSDDLRSITVTIRYPGGIVDADLRVDRRTSRRSRKRG